MKVHLHDFGGFCPGEPRDLDDLGRPKRQLTLHFLSRKTIHSTVAPATETSGTQGTGSPTGEPYAESWASDHAVLVPEGWHLNMVTLRHPSPGKYVVPTLILIT